DPSSLRGRGARKVGIVLAEVVGEFATLRVPGGKLASASQAVILPGLASSEGAEVATLPPTRRPDLAPAEETPNCLPPPRLGEGSGPVTHPDFTCRRGAIPEWRSGRR